MRNMEEDNTIKLVEVMFKISRFMKQEMSYTGKLIHLSILQIQALIFLKQHKEATMGDIAEGFHIELPSATSLLSKLCYQNLVERRTDSEDKRLVKISLTTKGITLLKEAMEERKKKLHKILSYLSEKEQSDLLTILETLNNRLKE